MPLRGPSILQHSRVWKAVEVHLSTVHTQKNKQSDLCCPPGPKAN